MVWGYIKSRETARRMKAYAGEVTSMHPHFAYDSPARAFDLDLATTKAYAGKDHLTAGIQHGKTRQYYLSFSICKLNVCRIVVVPSGAWQVTGGQLLDFQQTGCP